MSEKNVNDAAPRRNIELKARCRDLVAAAEAARGLGATFVGALNQLDTYFVVPNGRLKLRETEGKPAELIWYVRADTTEFRGSDYYVLPIPYAEETRTVLGSALGVRGAVRKRRQLYLWHNVRIHLDDVEGLGTFIEFEAVMGDGSDEESSNARLATLAETLKIRDEDRLAHSYSDLLGI